MPNLSCHFDVDGVSHRSIITRTSLYLPLPLYVVLHLSQNDYYIPVSCILNVMCVVHSSKHNKVELIDETFLSLICARISLTE